MKILMLNYEFPPVGGGGANANYYILREFAKNGQPAVDLVTCSADGSDRTELFAPNITLHRLNVRKKALHFWTQAEVLRWLWRAHRYVRKELDLSGYDICHAIFGFPSGMVAYLNRKRLPYIVSLRGSDVPGFNRRFAAQYIILKPVFRRIWRRAGAVVANSDGLRDLALQTDSVQIGVIPNGVDTEEFTPAEALALEWPRLMCVSRLIGRKGIDYLIRAMPMIIARRPEATLSIVGEGNLEADLRALARDIKVDKAVRFMGRVEHGDISKHYRAADIFVLPSKNEGMSNTVLEAIASGLPIVSTTVGGNSTLVKNDENGFLVEPADSEALADAVLRIAAAPELARKMGERSRHIAETMSWRNVAAAYVRLYRQCVESQA